MSNIKKEMNNDLKELDDMLLKLKELGKVEAPISPPPQPPNKEDSLASIILDKAPPPPSPIRTASNASSLPKAVTRLKYEEDDKPPVPPPRIKKSQSDFNILHPKEPVHQSMNDAPDEVDLSNHVEDEMARHAEEKRRKDAQRMSQFIQFERATAADFNDLDELLKELDDVYIKKTKNEATPSPHASQENVSKPPIVEPKPKLVLKKDNLPQKPAHIDNVNEKLEAADIKKVAVRIYVENARTFKTMILTTLMSAYKVTEDLIKKAYLEDKHEYAIFELINDYAIERPLRHYELVTDILEQWDKETINALMLKKYEYTDILTIEGTRTNYPRMCGMLYLEVKPGRWIKRYCELKANAIHHSKDSKGTNEALLCYLDEYDVYTLLTPRTKCPTRFCFALKFQGPKGEVRKDAEFVYYLAVDIGEKMKDWVWSIRSAKGQRILDANPHIEKDSSNYGKRCLAIKKAASLGVIKVFGSSREDDNISKTAPRTLPSMKTRPDLLSLASPLYSPPPPPSQFK